MVPRQALVQGKRHHVERIADARSVRIDPQNSRTRSVGAGGGIIAVALGVPGRLRQRAYLEFGARCHVEQPGKIADDTLPRRFEGRDDFLARLEFSFRVGTNAREEFRQRTFEPDGGLDLRKLRFDPGHLRDAERVNLRR